MGIVGLVRFMLASERQVHRGVCSQNKASQPINLQLAHTKHSSRVQSLLSAVTHSSIIYRECWFQIPIIRYYYMVSEPLN